MRTVDITANPFEGGARCGPRGGDTFDIREGTVTVVLSVLRPDGTWRLYLA